MNDSDTIPIWTPGADKVNNSNMNRFIKFVNDKKQLSIKNYNQLYDWSVNNISDFWETIWEFTEIKHSRKYTNILEGNEIHSVRWFSGARLNFAENLLRYNDDNTAIISQSENKKSHRISYKELHSQVARCAYGLKNLGVKKGDRVAAYVTNTPEAIIAMLAVSSIGAIWSSCSPDFGFNGVMERFGQIKPKILIAVSGYSYNGKIFDKHETIKQLTSEIIEIEKTIIIENIQSDNFLDKDKYLSWDDMQNNSADTIIFEQLPFDHPLYIMYSSGTTGKPKCIVHGAGGTLIQHLKELILHTDLSRDDVITFYTTCGWMMWNWLVSSLAVGAAVFLYDGSPSYPSFDVLFKAIENEKITIFGTSPKFLSSCKSSGFIPKNKYQLKSLKTILSTGAPLLKQNFEFVYENIKNDVQLSSISGGTDIISCFMLGNPMLSVYSEEIQCRGLGMKVETYNENSEPVTEEVGELVCCAPFPSRPIYFWDDPDKSKYLDTYFKQYPEIWRHGDYIKINSRGGIIVYGRSDATLNPGGVRIGTSEIYGPVESLKEIEDSIVVGWNTISDTEIILFVVLKNGYDLTESLIRKIKLTLKDKTTPRHVPKNIFSINEIPRTLNGKKMEIAVAKVINGQKITNKDALLNPESLEQFKILFNQRIQL